MLDDGHPPPAARAAPSSAMPFSTLSAVRTPGSDSPSSTSVIATAGRMPTTTVRASSTRAMAAMLASMRPMNESTISSAEMSISTPLRARRGDPRRSGRPAASSRAGRACRPGCVTRRQSPILRIGMRSMPGLTGPRRAVRRPARSFRSAMAKASASVALVITSCRSTPRCTIGLRDLRPDAADDALGAHQPRGGDGLEQVLRDQRVDRRHAGDVDDRDAGAGLDDASAAGSPSRPACARCRACRSAAARGCRPTA